MVNIHKAKIYKMENILMSQPKTEQIFTLLNVLIFKNKSIFRSITSLLGIFKYLG